LVTSQNRSKVYYLLYIVETNGHILQFPYLEIKVSAVIAIRRQDTTLVSRKQKKLEGASSLVNSQDLTSYRHRGNRLRDMWAYRKNYLYPHAVRRVSRI